MNYRQLGRTDMRVSEISFGAWAIGGNWGPVKDEESYAALNRAVEGSLMPLELFAVNVGSNLLRQEADLG